MKLKSSFVNNSKILWRAIKSIDHLYDNLWRVSKSMNLIRRQNKNEKWRAKSQIKSYGARQQIMLYGVFPTINHIAQKKTLFTHRAFWTYRTNYGAPNV